MTDKFSYLQNDNIFEFCYFPASAYFLKHVQEKTSMISCFQCKYYFKSNEYSPEKYLSQNNDHVDIQLCGLANWDQW